MNQSIPNEPMTNSGLGLSPGSGEFHQTPHQRWPSSASYPDSEGLQLSPDLNAPRDTFRDSEGLQPTFASSPHTLGIGSPVHNLRGGIEPEKYHNNPAAQPAILEAPPRRRRRWWFIGAAVVTVAIILAAVLGGVLGSRAHSSATSQAQPASTGTSQVNSTSPVEAGRVRSLNGTWNGTGITNFIANDDRDQGYLFFQDYTGTLLQAVYNIDSDYRLTLQQESLITLPCNASRGTGLGGLRDTVTANQSAFHLMYVNSDGVLSELYQGNAPQGSWQPGPGNLSSYNFKAPTDNRPAFYLLFGYLSGIADNSGGFRLYAGGTDDKVHQYSYDPEHAVWANTSTNDFNLTWAYGAAVATDNYDDTTNSTQFDRTVYLTDRNGSILSYVQTNGYDGNSTRWPKGGNWLNPTSTSHLTSLNSSLTLAVNATNESASGLIYADPAGHLGLQPTNLTFGPDAGHFGNLNTILAGSKAMQGSDIDYEVAFNQVDLFFYQDNGTSLAWAIVDPSEQRVLSSGHIVENGGLWSSVTS